MCIPPRSEPGRCPVCGMELSAVHGRVEDGSGAPRIRLSPEAMKLAEIQTVKVERRPVSAKIRLFGQIDYDPAHVTSITAFMPGVIDRVYVKRAGQFVRWGDPLFDIYSTDLLDTQRQLVEVLKYVPSFMAFQGSSPHAARDLPVQERRSVEKPDERSPEVRAAMKKLDGIRHKLSILGLPKRDIDELMKKGEATGLATIYSSVYGQVIDQRAYEGTYVNRGTPIFTIGDPRYVWARLDAYEADYPWLRLRQEVSFETDAYPGETFTAKVVYIDPVFNTKARTFKIGAVCPDKGGRLKPGMLVRAFVHARLNGEGQVSAERTGQKSPLVIPDTAPLITGKRAVVYVKAPGEEPVFEGREVKLGPRSESSYIVLAGLEEGEEVVRTGSFKIDSAVQILAKRSMMDIEGGHSAIAHHYHGGSDLMHEDYQQRRMENLMSGEPAQAPFLRSFDQDKGESEMESFRSRMGTGRPKAMIRRRPGMYGDTTEGGEGGSPGRPRAGSPLRYDKQRAKGGEHGAKSEE